MASEKVDVPVDAGGHNPAVAPTLGQVEATAGGNTKHSDLVEMTANARRATEKEHNMSLMQGLRLYPKAAAWSMFISLCIVMEGEFDTDPTCSSDLYPGHCFHPNPPALASTADNQASRSA